MTVLDRRVERTITTGIIRRFLTDSRQCNVLISDEGVAMDGMSIATAGLNIAQYQLNPVVLAYHDSTRPVGTMSNIHAVGTVLHGTVNFAPAGVSEDADRVCALVKAGIVKGVSIGFSVLDARPDRNGVTRVAKSVLHEVSLVTIPALNSAMVTERARASFRKVLETVSTRRGSTATVEQRRAHADTVRRDLARRGMLSIGDAGRREMAAAKRLDLQRRGLLT
jgi:HK97 family phage prohead protease